MKDGTVLLFFRFSPHFVVVFFPQFSVQFRGHYGLPPLVSVIFTGVQKKNKKKNASHPAGMERTPLPVSVAHALAQGGDWVCYITDRLPHVRSRQVVGEEQSGGVQLAP